jgi:hypothetical protein
MGRSQEYETHHKSQALSVGLCALYWLLLLVAPAKSAQDREEAEKFYHELAAHGMKVRVGMESDMAGLNDCWQSRDPHEAGAQVGRRTQVNHWRLIENERTTSKPEPPTDLGAAWAQPAY